MSAPRVAFANPGHLPWMAEAAAAFQEAHALSRYFGPAAFPREAVGRVEGTLGAIGRRVASELERRSPSSLPGDRIGRAATLHELAAVGAKRLGLPPRAARRLADRRDAAFDRGVSRKVNGLEADAISLGFGSAARTARTATAIRTLLDYPLTHHAYAKRLLSEEASLEPDFARTLQFHDPPRSRERRLDEELRSVDRVLVMSRYAKETFVAEGVEAERLAVLPFGVNLDLFSPGSEATGEPGAFRVLFVGQITQRKGISYLLEGFARAREPGWELVMVGAPVGDASRLIERPGVRNVPWCRQEDLPGLYRSADVFVLPSLIEGGFPRVTLEAMACAVPVLVTPAGGSGEALTDAEEGVALAERDPDGIASALSRLSSDRAERERMGASARRRAEVFSWGRYVTELSSIVRGIGDA